MSTHSCSYFRQVLFRLTRLGICVVATTCDGASDNRRLFSLHDTKNKMVYKTINVYSKIDDPVFLSQTHHILLRPFEIVLKEESCG